ncbi:type IV pilus secretin PilQ [Alkalimarinus sediminis]|uniref:Type IV pilus secretin PilQ n=1 Tax=Alkalimarinus sediminis TaxID=1632866 RepID=A0A9E8HGR6_9ALTE|nr:type IV pilus secretin PilQ [Alkalimarinus sediminis]UZW73930.1 type IV pilus secretin PilQ [Alkalimarinus sediminis]
MNILYAEIDNKQLRSKNNMYYRALMLVGALCFSLFSIQASAVELKDISFASLAGDRTEVTLAFDGTPPEPKGYTIEKPARIALDLIGVNNGLSAKYHSLGVGNAQGLTVIGAKDRTRLIVNLVELVPYASTVDGNNIVLMIGSADAPKASTASATNATKTAAPAASSSAKAAVTNVDFRRGDKGEGQVVLTLSSPKIDVDMSEEGGLIKLMLAGIDLPESLQRRLDVADFATPVKRIDSKLGADGVEITIKSEGNYDYLAYQADNQFTISVEELTPQEVEQRKKDKFPYTGEKLSLNFQDIEVRSVLQLIADFTGLNLVASDTVGGRITLRLQNVPWDQALELVLKTKGLDKRKIGNVLLVAPADEIAAREKLELETNKQVAALAPVRLEVVQINYAKAEDIVALLQADKELISGRGFISSDERTNTISVRETADKQEQIRRLIATWDIPVRQVLIEARIVKARTNIASDLGVQWGGAGLADHASHQVFGGGSFETTSQVTQGETITFPGANVVDLGVTKAGASSFALGFSNDHVLLQMELSALESDGRGEIVAQPKVVTADRQTATIKSGEEIPYQEASSSGATSVSFKEAVLSLEVTPQITPDGKVIMDLKINQDNRGEVTAGIPSIETNEIVTQVLVGNGETVVLGGIFQTEESTTITKTPYLGDIPYLGTLFKRTEKVDERAELLIFITPKLLKRGLIDN